MSKRSSHGKALETIANKPHIFGIEKPLAVSIEPSLYDKKGRLIAQPDIVFYHLSRKVTVIEYKSNGNDDLLERAQQQLANATYWFGKHIPIKPEVRIIDGSQYKELKKIR